MRHGYASVLLAPFHVLVAITLIAITATPAIAQQRTLCVHGLEAPTSLLVRSGPGVERNVIGRFPAKACGVRLAGRCVGEWCQMALGDTFGWVKTTHIAVYELPGTPAQPGTRPGVAVAAMEPPPPRVAKAEAPPARRPAPRVGERDIEQGSKESSKERQRDLGTCVTGVDDDDTLRVRRGPGVDHDEIAKLPPTACGISVTDKCRGSWCRVAWRGRAGWVNTYYLD